MSTQTEEILDIVTSHQPAVYVHIVNPPANMHIQIHGDMAMTAKEIVEYARRNQLEVVCLCGYRFVPTRNPEAVNDTCPICIDVAGMLMRNQGE